MFVSKLQKIPTIVDRLISKLLQLWDARIQSVLPLLQPSQRTIAVVAIGDGLGNIVAQTPLVRAVTEMFDVTYVWMPASRKDLPSLIQDMAGIAKVSTEWEEDFNNAVAIFQTWLVSGHASRIRPKALKARYIAQKPKGKMRSEVDFCLDAARKAGWSGNIPEPYVGTEKWRGDECIDYNGLIVGFSTGRLNKPEWRLKEYPPEYYSQVIDILEQSYPSIQFIQLGWEHDRKIEHPKIIDTRSRGSLRETLGLISCCTVFCGNDTGLCWAANAMGVSTVVVFGPTDPVKCLAPWGAVPVSLGIDCQPCQWREMGRLINGDLCGHECMLKLPPRKVAEKIMFALM